LQISRKSIFSSAAAGQLFESKEISAAVEGWKLDCDKKYGPLEPAVLESGAGNKSPTQLRNC
jgi:hypothetical protein